MRKYQQKLLNQNYMAHLSNLRLIKNRKPLNEEGAINRTNHQPHFLEKKEIKIQNERMLKSIENPKRVLLSRGSNPKRNLSAQQKRKMLRFQNSLLENKIIKAQSIVSTFQQTLPNLKQNKYWNKMTQLGNFTRTQKLKQFLSQQKKQNKQIGKGHSKLQLKIICLNIFNSNICKQNQNQLSFQFNIGNQSFQSQLIPPSKLVGQQFHLRFKPRIFSQIFVGIQQYRGIKSHCFGYFQIDAKQLIQQQQQQYKVFSKLIYKNKNQPVGMIQYSLKIQV